MFPDNGSKGTQTCCANKKPLSACSFESHQFWKMSFERCDRSYQTRYLRLRYHFAFSTDLRLGVRSQRGTKKSTDIVISLHRNAPSKVKFV